MKPHYKYIFKSKLFFYTAFVLIFASTVTCKKNNNIIQDSKETEQVKESLAKAKESKKDTDFSLEETVRIINALQIARKNSNSSNEFLMKLAKQDYSNVANDVIEAKTKLIPILNRLQHEERKLEKSKDLWKNFSKISSVAMEEGSKIALKATVSGGLDPSMLVNVASASKKTFDIIRKSDDLEEEVKDAILNIETDYIAYINEFSSVYFKYLKKWDRVCLYRDNAYLSINQRDINSALHSLGEVLKISPDDKEALLMKSLCLLYKAQANNSSKNQDDINRSYDVEAKNILQNYLNNHPNESAPALLLLGTYHKINGNNQKAINYYNQSSIEYPRQAMLLLDMFNSYKKRSYILKSAEGHYILKLYKSMMLGFGFFSPNFQKSIIAYNKEDFKESKEEILRHFFRRGNQESYDYLISDMNYCKEYLSKSYELIFKEKSFLDLKIENQMFNTDKLDISIKNNSDVKLSNVRLFLCVHFTDMYKDDYKVFKIDKTVSNLNANEEVSFGELEINYELYDEKKKTEDIVNTRAIILSDKFISWVDKKEFKISKAKKSYIKEGKKNIDEMISHLGINYKELINILTSYSIIDFESSYMNKDNLTIKLPRELAALSPVFSLNELNSTSSILPEDINIDGSNIKMDFDINVPKNEIVNLFLNTSGFRVKLDLKRTNDDTIEIKDYNLYK